MIESPGAATEQAPRARTDRIAERNADTDAESRSRSRGGEPGQRSPWRGAARQALPRVPTAAGEPGTGILLSGSDAGAVTQATPDAGAGAIAAGDPGGAVGDLAIGIGAHADDDLDEVPLGDETRLRANVSSYAGFINSVRDRVRRVWRVREVYQRADPSFRFTGDALVTEVGVRVAADGSVAEVKVEKSSGLGPIDEEAASALKRAGPFPPPVGITDAQGGVTFQVSFTLDLSQLRYLTAARQALLDRWQPSRAFRRGGDRDRVTTIRVLLKDDGIIAQINPVGSAGIDFLDSGALAALKLGDRLPPPPEGFPRLSGGVVPVWVEFRHRVGAPSDVWVRRRFVTGNRP